MNLKRDVTANFFFCLFSSKSIKFMFYLQFYIRGVQNVQEGLIVEQNFTGCFENLYMNSTNFIRHLRIAFEVGERLRFERVNALNSRPEPPIIQFTF